MHRCLDFFVDVHLGLQFKRLENCRHHHHRRRQGHKEQNKGRNEACMVMMLKVHHRFHPFFFA